ncbi:MAG TPA: hypothetical protein VHZ26_20295 [Caulobacteraceae bacterium]|jgi:hypothetical protein|nr:hypothetical protein [Caulobacteraceae bacterium]
MPTTRGDAGGADRRLATLLRWTCDVLWRLAPFLPASPRRRIAKSEQSAEAAYAAMYDARPYSVKDCYDDARAGFRRAIAVAKQTGQAGEAERLTRRLDQIQKVYNSQFRDVGR